MITQLSDDPEVVSPEAEKVNVLQTPISPYRTTFYNKKSAHQQAMAQMMDDPEVVSPEAEKVSVLQTPISPYRTTFYNKRSAPHYDQFVQREPLLSWSPTPDNGFKKNYFVPNFGGDSDINASKAHEAKAGEKLGHTWTPTKDEDGEWELPSFKEFRL